MKPRKLTYTVVIASIIIWIFDSLLSASMMTDVSFLDVLILDVPIDALYFRIFLTFLLAILATFYYYDLKKQNLLKQLDLQIPGYIMDKNHEDYEILNKFFHSIRTQLNNIVGFTSLLRESNLSEETSNRYIENLESSKESLQRSVDELLEAYREKKHLKYRVKIPGIIEEVDWTSKSILIAEDNEANYVLLDHLLRNTGAEISWVTDGKQAVETILKRKDIDLVLMDIIMPEMDGIEATNEIRKINPEIPIIAQTAQSHNWKESAMDLFDEILLKPIWEVELLQKCAKYLKKPKKGFQFTELPTDPESLVS